MNFFSFFFVGVLLQGQITEIDSHKDGWPHDFFFQELHETFVSIVFFFSSSRFYLNSLGVFLLPWICFASGDLFCCFFFLCCIILVCIVHGEKKLMVMDSRLVWLPLFVFLFSLVCGRFCFCLISIIIITVEYRIYHHSKGARRVG